MINILLNNDLKQATTGLTSGKTQFTYSNALPKYQHVNDC